MSSVYDRRLLNDAEVTRAIGDILSGITTVDDVTLELENADGFFNSLDLRGDLLEMDRFDRADGESLPEMTGLVVEQRVWSEKASLRVATQDLDAYQTLIPKRLITAAVFPKAHATTGLNLPIAILFGTVDRLELPFVNDDTVSNYYDYLVGEGTPTVNAVYRDTVGDTIALVPGAEYAVNNSAFPGFRVLRFTKRQVNFGGGLHRIYADLTGLTIERNFVRAIQAVWSNATWGLGLSVNTASFDAGAAKLDTIGNLFCDGVIREQRPALDYLNQLYMVRGMRVKKNSAGERIISVDTSPQQVKATFGHGPGQPWRNVRTFDGVSNTPVSEAVKTLVLDYRLNLRTKTYLLSASRAVLALGQEKRIQHDFIRDRVTGDKTCDYLGKTLYYGDRKIGFVAGQEARAILEGDLVQYLAPSVGLTTATVFRTLKVRRRIEDVHLDAQGWDPAIYVYQAGTLPAEPISDIGTDWSNTTPGAITSLSILSSGVEQATDGTWSAYVVLQYTVPDESWAQTHVKVRRTGTATWETWAVEAATGAAKQTRLNGLICGQAYDYQIVRVNTLTPALSATTELDNQTAPSTTIVPSAPSAISIIQGTGKSVKITLTATPPLDWADTWLYRKTTNVAPTGVELQTPLLRGKTLEFTDLNVALGTTYYYWAALRNSTGLQGGLSPSSGHAITLVTVPDEEISGLASSKLIGSIVDSQIFSMAVNKLIGQVITPQISSNAVTVDGYFADDSPVIFADDFVELEVGSITISTDGGSVVIIGKANAISVQLEQTKLLLRKNTPGGPVLDTAILQITTARASGPLSAPLIVVGQDASPDPTQTYKLMASGKWSAGAGISLVRLFCLNRKK